jgi:hypothetical protein
MKPHIVFASLKIRVSEIDAKQAIKSRNIFFYNFLYRYFYMHAELLQFNIEKMQNDDEKKTHTTHNANESSSAEQNSTLAEELKRMSKSISLTI